MRARVGFHSNGTNLDASDRDAYVHHFLDDNQWIEIAEGLVNAARALQSQVDAYWSNESARARDSSLRFPSDAPHRIQLMMFSFAIENLMKAFLIREKKAEYEVQMKSNPILPQELRTHDLVKLAIAVGEVRPSFKRDFDHDREELLRRLTRRATWSGRYPVPLHYRQLQGEERFLDGTVGLLSYKTSADPNEAIRLVNELCIALNLRHLAIATNSA
jgi:hypothetical protein